MAVADVVAELTRNAVDVLPHGELEQKLALGRPLRVKLGIDVTSPDIHIGRGIPLQRMRAFQEAGHIGVLIVGDYTTRIGDPSGRKTERPMIDPAVIDANAQRYSVSERDMGRRHVDSKLHAQRPVEGELALELALGQDVDGVPRQLGKAHRPRV